LATRSSTSLSRSVSADVDRHGVGLRLRLGLGAEVGHHAARDRRAQRRLALADALQLLGDQLARLLLQDVAEGAGLQRREQVFVVVVDGDHHDCASGCTSRSLVTTSTPTAVGQAQVDQRQVELHRSAPAPARRARASFR
jgi:hypothetical protein